MIDSKIIDKVNELNCKKVYTKDGVAIRWPAELDENIDIVAPFMNTFASQKNIDKWLEFCGVGEDKPKDLTLDIDLSAMTKQDIKEYAKETYQVELNTRDTKEDMIQKLEDTINGLHN